MKKILSLIMVVLMLLSFGGMSVFASDNSVSVLSGDALLAFPEAQGGGKYTKGARAALDVEGGSIEVYHVTNLNADGEGSFADAISADPIETDAEGNEIAKPPVGRIIVFDVGGVINFPVGKKIERDYVTILGQTAPGDGITLTGGDLQIGNAKKQVIMRYMRVRPTDDTGSEVDGIGGQWNQDVIIDHCSTSWCVDECLTLYAGNVENSSGYKQGERLTVQNTISSESLRMSNHFKGAHGYGGIIGGTNATYYGNLFAHHDSRSPRLDRILNKTDIRNNIVYNWGVTNSAYGGEPTSPHPGNARGEIRPSLINYSNNYYKFGPSTVAGKRYRIYDFKDLAKEVGKTYEKEVDGEKVKFTVEKSKFYMTDNYVFGSSAVTGNNWHNDGTNSASNQVEKMDTPFLLGDENYPDLNIPDDKLLAGKDVLSILDDVGATLPKRDNIDARVIADVINQTGRIINRDEEVGGFTGIQTSKRTFEIPADWKAANGMESAKDNDIVQSGKWAGYTWTEAYVNDWTAEQSQVAPTNPTVTVTSPAIAAMNGTSNKSKWKVMKDNETLSYKATATPAAGTAITKMELYDEETLLKTYDGSSINDNISLAAGTHYLTCLAYNDKGESTRSTTSIVYVNGSVVPEGWSHKQIGTTTYNGLGAISYDAEKNQYLVSGSGKLAGDTKYFDLCDFMYKEITGDFDISLKIDELPKNENGPAFGIMLREGLDSKSRMASIVDGWIKFGRNERIVARTTAGKGIYVDPAQNNSTDNKMGAFMTGRNGEIVSGNVLGEHPFEAYHPANYLRMQRSGDTLIFSVSDGGTDWTDNDRQPYTLKISNLASKLYVGVVIDSQMNQSDASPQLYYSQAKFSELKIENQSNYDGDTDPTPTPTPDNGFVKYSDWNIGQTGASATGGAALETEWKGKTALQITNRNVYTTLDKTYNSGVVSFSTDVYITPSADKNAFRIYLENEKAKNYQDSKNTLGGVIAEVVNTTDGWFCAGPVIGNSNKIYDYSGEAEGWFNVNISIDYNKQSTDNSFISLKVTNSEGNEVINTSMPAIANVDTGLKQIRLIARSSKPYFADMEVTSGIVSTDVFYTQKPAFDGNTVTASVQNLTDTSGAFFLAVAYNKNKIAEAKFEIVPVGETAQEVALTFGDAYTDVRCYLWSNLSLKPYSNVIKMK